MRYFKLTNSKGNVLDITTKTVLFHDISGIGFEESTDFRSVGTAWRLNSAEYSQTTVSGTMCFTNLGDKTPYQLYSEFKEFIVYTPLVLSYFPHGENSTEYLKKVRVTSLEKTEINEYGVLESGIEFTPYTPWYEIKKAENDQIDEDTSEDAWIWGDGGDNPPVIFREIPDGTSGILPIFRREFRAPVVLDSLSDNGSPVKITIYGPALNPTWAHYVDDVLVESGAFSSSSAFSLAAGETLVIDNTEGAYSMKVYSNAAVPRNVYSMRNFDLKCFFTLKPGRNSIVVSSSDGADVHVDVEGYIQYATV